LLFLMATILLPYWRLFPEVTNEYAVPLHYNIHSGVDRYGSWKWIFMSSIIGASIFFINNIACVYFWKRDRVLSELFLVVSALSQVLLFAAVIFVVLLNLSYASL